MGLARMIESRASKLPSTIESQLDLLRSFVTTDDGDNGKARGAQLLARLDVAHSLGSDPGPLFKEVFKEVDAFLSAGRRPVETIDWLDRLDVAAKSFEIARRPRYAKLAVESAERIIEARQRHGSWFPLAYAADRHNLSAVWGLAAVGRAFLRARDPDRVPSLRVLRLPNPRPAQG